MRLQPSALPVLTSQNVIGPGNVISGNLRGVRISGAGQRRASWCCDNLIGTDITGKFDLGNSLEGVRIEDATDAVVQGDAKGSQVISGNLIGVVIAGRASTRNPRRGQPDRLGQDRPRTRSPTPGRRGHHGAPGNTIGGNHGRARGT